MQATDVTISWSISSRVDRFSTKSTWSWSDCPARLSSGDHPQGRAAAAGCSHPRQAVPCANPRAGRRNPLERRGFGLPQEGRGRSGSFLEVQGRSFQLLHLLLQ